MTRIYILRKFRVEENCWSMSILPKLCICNTVVTNNNWDIIVFTTLILRRIFKGSVLAEKWTYVQFVISKIQNIGGKLNFSLLKTIR